MRTCDDICAIFAGVAAAAATLPERASATPTHHSQCDALSRLQSMNVFKQLLFTTTKRTPKRPEGTSPVAQKAQSCGRTTSANRRQTRQQPAGHAEARLSTRFPSITTFCTQSRAHGAAAEPVVLHRCARARRAACCCCSCPRTAPCIQAPPRSDAPATKERICM